MSYSSDKEGKGIFIPIPVKRVKEIIALNRKGIIPPKAVEASDNVQEDIKYTDGVGEESLNRFDEKKQPKKRKNRNNGNNNAHRNENKEQNRTHNNNHQGQRPQRNNPRTEQRRDQRPQNRPKPKADQNAQ